MNQIKKKKSNFKKMFLVSKMTAECENERETVTPSQEDKRQQQQEEPQRQQLDNFTAPPPPIIHPPTSPRKKIVRVKNIHAEADQAEEVGEIRDIVRKSKKVSKCQICNIEFPNERMMKEHIRKIHEEVKSNKRPSRVSGKKALKR